MELVCSGGRGVPSVYLAACWADKLASERAQSASRQVDFSLVALWLGSSRQARDWDRHEPAADERPAPNWSPPPQI